jgi:hypothetical protein
MFFKRKHLSLASMTLALMMANYCGASETLISNIGGAGVNTEQREHVDQSTKSDVDESSNAGKTEGIEVVYSDWFTASDSIAGDWSERLSFGHRVIYFDLPVPELSSEILDSGLIIVKGNLRNYNNSIWQLNDVSNLPIALMYTLDGETQIDNWDYRVSEGLIQITLQDSTDRYSASSIGSNHRFRYIIMPANIPAEVFRDRFELQN